MDWKQQYYEEALQLYDELEDKMVYQTLAAFHETARVMSEALFKDGDYYAETYYAALCAGIVLVCTDIQNLQEVIREAVNIEKNESLEELVVFLRGFTDTRKLRVVIILMGMVYGKYNPLQD
jgi:hypothetical protein